MVDSRQGVNLTVQEAKQMASIIGPLLKQGQSPYRILVIQPDLGISEKTLYNYIENGVFQEMAGLTVMNLRRQVSRKLPKKKANAYKKRVDRKYLEGRTFKEYQAYISDHSDVLVTQMDTVYNDGTNGPFLQTFQFVKTGLFLALYRESKTAASMKEGVDLLESSLGTALFRKYVHILLTDRGAEFSAAEAMETSSDGSRRTRVFTVIRCNPVKKALWETSIYSCVTSFPRV